jgi:hypothetical protein
MMKISAAFSRRLRWLNLPGAVLVALLQRTPVVRVAAVADELVAASPLGSVLRSATAGVAALGAVHALAGATQVVATQGTTPTNSVNTTVGTPISPVVFVTNGSPTIALSYLITGVPPGLTVPGLNSSTNILNITNPLGSGVISGTPTTAGSFPMRIQAWEFSNLQGNFSVPITVLFTVAPAGVAGLTITTQPANLVSAIGESATFTVGVSANPAPSYQWKKNGFAIAGAIGASLTIPNVLLTDAGNYTVDVTNSFGTKTSDAATLTVNVTTSAPTFLTQPTSQSVATGSTVVFTAAANGAPTPVLQWRRNGVSITGATKPTLVLTGANVVAGDYTVVATNSSNAVPSNVAKLTLVSTVDVGRLINLSILTTVTAADPFFTVGTVLGGGLGSARKPLLVRAVGPSLVQIGVPGVLADPKLEMFTNGSSSFASNDNWGDDPGLVAVMKQVGAFALLPNANSRDAAVFNSATPTGQYTVQVSGVGSATGTVIAEIYDATAAGAFTTSTPRLLDVSVLKKLAAGSTISAGFIIGGTTAKTVLVRAIGPGLAQLGVGGFMADPRVTLFNAQSVKIAENDNWGGDAQLTAAMESVGAFAPADPASKDAVLLLTLPPGNYSAVAEGVTNTAGFVIVEVYEVP